MSSPLPPQRYRALRARYNAPLVLLYERSTLTVRDIAAAAGHTKRAVYMLARALGCRPRNATHCRPGTDVGVRRAGPRPPQLNAPATRRVLAAFAAAARELAASAQAHAAAELQRAMARAKRRTMRTQSRVMASAARELSHYAGVIENAAAARRALASGGKRKVKRPGAGRRARPPNWPSPEEMFERQQHGLRQQALLMYQAHDAARAAKAATAVAPATPEPETEANRRLNAIAERSYAAPPRGPRIRGL